MVSTKKLKTEAGTVAAPPVEPVTASSSSKQGVDASGKKLQRVVNEKKRKAEERERAANLLEQNAGKFTVSTRDDGAGAAEGAEDEAPDEGDEGAEILSFEGRLEAAVAAWAVEVETTRAANKDDMTSPVFDVGEAARRDGGESAPVSFGVFRHFLECVSQRPGCVCVAVANLVRLVVQRQSPDTKADVCAILSALLRRKNQKIPHKFLCQAIAAAFGMPKDKSETWSADEVADVALNGRQKQPALWGSQKKLLLSTDTAKAAIYPYAMTKSGHGTVPDFVVKLIGRSTAKDGETWHLVRVLQGRPGFSHTAVLKGFAHAVVLSPPAPGGPTPSFASAEERARAMVDAEDQVFALYGRCGGSAEHLAAAAFESASTDGTPAPQVALRFAAACPPTIGRQIIPMRAERPKDFSAALERLHAVGCDGTRSGALLAEWLLVGDRVQIHIRDAGKVITVFSKDLGDCPDRIEEARAALQGHLTASTQECIIEAIFMRRRGNKEAGGATFGDALATDTSVASTLASSSSSTFTATQADADTSEGNTSGATIVVVFDMLLLNGDSLLHRPLRQRRKALKQSFNEHASLRLCRAWEISLDAPNMKDEIMAKLDEVIGARHLATSSDEKAVTKASGLVLKCLDGPGAVYVPGGRVAKGWQTVHKPPLTGKEAGARLYESLTEEEKKYWPSLDEFHFTVISGFRTRTVEGINDILRIQNLYSMSGVSPTWYVDNECPDEYRTLGLNVVKAGKLIPARNRALEDAAKKGKVCVETSDDIGSWCIVNDANSYNADSEANAAFERAEKLYVPPAVAAQYLLTKMRSLGRDKCRLGGVYPLSNGGRAMRTKSFSTTNFILGDFFVSDLSEEENKECRFDETMTLKEDYDFSMNHLTRFGMAYRCNRLIITAKHETNAGGACDARDAAGTKEQYNIKILKKKWPGCFSDHPTRANQVVMRFKKTTDDTKEAGIKQAQSNDVKGTPQEDAA